MSEQELPPQKTVDLDHVVNVLAQVVNNVRDLKNQTERSAEYIAAMLNVVDEGQIFNLDNIKESLIKVRVAKLDGMLKKQVEMGLLQVSTLADEKSLIVACQTDLQNKEINRKIVFPVNELPEDERLLFVDKKVGDVVLLNCQVKNEKTGGTDIEKNNFLIKEIYLVVDQVEKPIK